MQVSPTINLHAIYVTSYEKRDHLGFFIKIEFLACMDSFVYAAYNGESSKKKH